MRNPPKKNYSVQATSTSPRLTQLNTTLPIAPVEFKNNYPWLVNNICVSILTENILMLLSVSNQGY